MPVIFREQHERRWFSKSSELSQILNMLNPYPHHLMNAYPIANTTNDNQNNLSAIQPIGRRIYSERITPHSRKRAKGERDYSNSPTMGEVAAMGRN